MAKLIFGVDVSTSAAAGDNPVAAAQDAERLGYDFVSASDHPCGSHPSYETPTLLTWIAAHTSRITVATRVLGVPFRRPAMVAKMAASLDLLSGGRFILGLGAGHADTEIDALGGPVPSARAKIDGLAEAVQIIRGAWTMPGYRLLGQHHSAHDLDMQPRPARRIPVWLGTFGPRALAVTGTLADGWIPSLGFAPPEQIPAMRHRIDAAADAAGRDTADIRGIYNVGVRLDPAASPQPGFLTGSPAQVIDQLHHYLELGFTGVNFCPTGPGRTDQVVRIAEEILPAMRTAAA